MSSAHCILLVEDEPGCIQLVHRALSDTGCEAVLYAVQTADLAEQFLGRREAFAAMPTPQLVVLDLCLSDGGSGLEILASMRDHPRWRAIPVAVLTSDAAPETRARCIDLGVMSFASKPEDCAGYRAWADELLAALARRGGNEN
jgi:CheY-like chemotaxis protein